MAPREAQATAVLEVSGVQWATEKNVAEAVLSRRPGVLTVDVNPVAQTATVTYDPSHSSVAELAGWVRDCGYHCAGQSVPNHICDPLLEATVHADRDHGLVGGDHGPDHAAAVTQADRRPRMTRTMRPRRHPQPLIRMLSMLATPLLRH